MLSALRRATKAVRRSRVMWPMGSTRALTLAGATGRRGSTVILARRSCPTSGVGGEAQEIGEVPSQGQDMSSTDSGMQRASGDAPLPGSPRPSEARLSRVRVEIGGTFLCWMLRCVGDLCEGRCRDLENDVERLRER